MTPLLVSAPNKGGGVAIIENGRLSVQWRGGATGLCFGETEIALARQDRMVYLADDNGTARVDLGDEADVHDVRLANGRLYAVITGRNQIIEADTRKGEIIRSWTFPGDGDSWHLNCLTDIDGKLCFSAFGQFPAYRGYKGAPDGTGFIAELESGRILIDGMTHPHSILSDGSAFWVCNSRPKEVWRVEGGKRRRSDNLGGYTRGLCLADGVLYVGISMLRHTPDEGKLAYVLALDPYSLKPIRRIDTPFKEIYDLLPLASPRQQALAKSVIRASGQRRWLGRLSTKTITLPSPPATPNHAVAA